MTAEINHRIEQVLGGNLEAFSDIYNATIDRVYRTLFFLTDNKNDVDDLVQDVYVELYRSLRNFDGKRPFQPWLYGITIRQHQAYKRKSGGNSVIKHK
ncbi:sigma factor, partial [Paenibacillus sp. TAF43_2]|uniref:sigma factor n=1 Tax=Paenibacillus sp. TAF43_2 TaxID=3233069 RepID=UPI003F9BAC05